MTQVDTTLGAAVVAPVEALGPPMAATEPTLATEATEATETLVWCSPVVQTLALTAGPSTSDAPRIPPRRAR